MDIKIDPALPLTVTVDFQSPQVAAYRFWKKSPGDIISTELGSGTDKGPSDPTTYPFRLSTQLVGGQVSYYIKLYGNANQPYRVVISLAQNGAVLPGGAWCWLARPMRTALG